MATHAKKYVATGDISHSTTDEEGKRKAANKPNEQVELHAGDEVPNELFTEGELAELLRLGAIRERSSD